MRKCRDCHASLEPWVEEKRTRCWTCFHAALMLYQCLLSWIPYLFIDGPLGLCTVTFSAGAQVMFCASGRWRVVDHSHRSGERTLSSRGIVGAVGLHAHLLCDLRGMGLLDSPCLHAEQDDARDGVKGGRSLLRDNEAIVPCATTFLAGLATIRFHVATLPALRPLFPLFQVPVTRTGQASRGTRTMPRPRSTRA